MKGNAICAPSIYKSGFSDRGHQPGMETHPHKRLFATTNKFINAKIKRQRGPNPAPRSDRLRRFLNRRLQPSLSSSGEHGRPSFSHLVGRHGIIRMAISPRSRLEFS